MTTKIFAEINQFQLKGDARGFILDSGLRTEYWQWCQDNGITTEYQGGFGNADLWYIKNDEHRVWALLRWS